MNHTTHTRRHALFSAFTVWLCVQLAACQDIPGAQPCASSEDCFSDEVCADDGACVVVETAATTCDLSSCVNDYTDEVGCAGSTCEVVRCAEGARRCGASCCPSLGVDDPLAQPPAKATISIDGLEQTDLTVTRAKWDPVRGQLHLWSFHEERKEFIDTTWDGARWVPQRHSLFPPPFGNFDVLYTSEGDVHIAYTDDDHLLHLATLEGDRVWASRHIAEPYLRDDSFFTRVDAREANGEVHVLTQQISVALASMSQGLPYSQTSALYKSNPSSPEDPWRRLVCQDIDDAGYIQNDTVWSLDGLTYACAHSVWAGSDPMDLSLSARVSTFQDPFPQPPFNRRVTNDTNAVVVHGPGTLWYEDGLLLSLRVALNRVDADTVESLLALETYSGELERLELDYLIEDIPTLTPDPTADTVFVDGLIRLEDRFGVPWVFMTTREQPSNTYSVYFVWRGDTPELDSLNLPFSELTPLASGLTRLPELLIGAGALHIVTPRANDVSTFDYQRLPLDGLPTP